MDQSPTRGMGAPGRGGKGWGTPSPLPRCPTRPLGERQQETIKQIEPRGGSSIMNPEQEKLLEFELDLEVEEILKKVKADRVPDQGVTQFAQQLEERYRQKRTAQID